MGQFEWESSNLHIAYPFEQPGVPGQNDAFVDAVVMDTQQSKRVRVQSLDILAWDALSISIDVRYEDGTAFFASDPDIQVDVYGDWVLITACKGDKEVQLTMNGLYSLPISFVHPVTFVTRVQECDPKAVKSIQVTDGVTSVTHVLTGDLLLQTGYNMSLLPAPVSDTARTGSVGVSLSAVPGAGLGIAPSDCAPATVLRSINTVGPDDKGHFVLSAGDCYRCIIPSVSGTPPSGTFDPLVAALKLYNDCEQCCKCKDYENTYKALTRLHGNGRNSGERMARAIDDFNSLKNEVERQKDLREIPTMALMLRPTPGYIMGVVATFLNNPTFPTLNMDTDDRDLALCVIKVTSPDVDMTNAKVISKSCYVFNSRYGNPWLHVARDQILVPSPPVFTDPDGTGLIVKETVFPGKYYNIIETTEFISIFFEIFWPDSASPENDDTIEVTLESDIFSPYTLLKTDKLIQPFDGTEE